MKDEFLKILKEHRFRYPQMEPQDFAKLIYQSEFGPEHMIEDKASVVAYLKKELEDLPKEMSPRSVESIGGGLCRFPLSVCTSQQALELYADLFVQTAKESQGTTEGIQDKLEAAEELQISGMKEWIEEWKAQGYPPVHHSSAYRMAYQPHYRLLKKEYAVYFPALLEISRLMKEEKPVLVGIDGRCGSGKSHFAKVIQRLFPCNVMHMDDFYLPSERRPENWNKIAGGNIDFDRFRSEVLHPVWAGETVQYRPYHCQSGLMEKELPLPPRKLTVVEGSYSHHPSLMAQYHFKIFLTCSKQNQAERLKKREGNYFPAFLECWIPMEEHYFAQYSIAANSDMVVKTDLI